MRRPLPDLRTAFLGGLRLGRGAGRRRSWRRPAAGVGGVPGRSWRSALARWRGRGAGLALLAGLVVYAAVATAAGVRYERVTAQPADPAGRDRGPRRRSPARSSTTRARSRGGSAPEVLVRLEVRQVECRTGRLIGLREPVLVFGRDVLARRAAGGHGAGDRPPGRRVRRRRGRGASRPSEPPDIRAGPDPWWRASGAVRAALRESVAGLPPDRRALVPALVDGDDAGLDPALADDFRTTGLTHLLAVSGTNLTLVVGFAAGAWRAGAGARPLAVPRRRRRDRRVRAAGAGRAERAAGRGDGLGGAARDGRERR